MPIHDWSRVGAGAFHDFHLSWIGRLKGLLNEEVLPEPYYALAEPVLGESIPDVLTLQSRGATPAPEAGEPAAGLKDDAAESAVLLAPSAVRVEDLVPSDPYALLARQILIHDRLEGDEVVAAIEFVSRANKSSRVRRDQFVDKSLTFVQRGIHLLILDLQKPTALVPDGFHALIGEAYGGETEPPPEDRRHQAVSYQVLEGGLIRAHVVPLRPGDRLPEMPVFLEPHRFVRLPLERSYAEAFAESPRPVRRTLEER